jgi:23S rRNA (cytidine1920-2'-O)/16S rRNA (cytidine1409-2'-O)-methyltransferase
VATRTEALEAIASGLVVVSGTAADKPARQVAPQEPIVLLGPPARFVSRGGEKLDAALSRFAIDPTDCRAIDAGASTGGFTHCLLQRGAARVYAVDVGHGQLDQRLRSDDRVAVFERVNVRTLTSEILRQGDPTFTPVPLVTADLSFISLVTVVPALTGPVSADGADLVLLVKPQFEAGRVVVARGKGVVRDPEVWRQALNDVTSALHAAGTGIMGAMVSPLTGPAGNVEYLVHSRKGHPGAGPAAVAIALDEAVAEAVARRDADLPPST